MIKASLRPIRKVKHISYLTHVKLKGSSLFFHLLCDLSPADLCPDHPVLLGMLPLLFLNLITRKSRGGKSTPSCIKKSLKTSCLAIKYFLINLMYMYLFFSFVNQFASRLGSICLPIALCVKCYTLGNVKAPKCHSG